MDGLAADILESTDHDKLDEPEAHEIERARCGDVEAFERLYRGHAAAVYGLCLRMSGSHAQAEELTQEAFVRAWRALGGFRGEAALGSWLHRLAVNVVLENRRSARRRSARVVSVEDPASLGKAKPESPDRTMDLERAMADLPEGARTIFILHDVEGYRHEEIAAMQGLSTGTTKAQLHRARRLLREALG